jgi:hypothetical protein
MFQASFPIWFDNLVENFHHPEDVEECQASVKAFPSILYSRGYPLVNPSI